MHKRIQKEISEKAGGIGEEIKKYLEEKRKGIQ
jgi:hypothetical protein